MSEQALRSTNNQGAILDRYEVYERSGVTYCGAAAVAHYFTQLRAAEKQASPADMTQAFYQFMQEYRSNRGEATDATALAADEAGQRSLEHALASTTSVSTSEDLQELRSQLAVAPVEYILQSEQELFDSRKQQLLRIGRVSLYAMGAMHPAHQSAELIHEGQREYLLCGCQVSGDACPRHRLKQLLLAEAAQFTPEQYQGEPLPDVRARLDGNVSAAIAADLVSLESALPVLSQLYRDV